MTRARRVEVPERFAAWAGTDGSSYALAMELPTPAARSRTPVGWARAVFEGSPRPYPQLLVLGWRLGLGLRLGPRHSPDHVLGWRIVDSTDDGVAVEAASRLVSARNIVAVGDASVTWVTLVRYQRPAGRLIWSVIAPVHQLTLPWLLARAARTAPRGGPPAGG